MRSSGGIPSYLQQRTFGGDEEEDDEEEGLEEGQDYEHWPDDGWMEEANAVIVSRTASVTRGIPLAGSSSGITAAVERSRMSATNIGTSAVERSRKSASAIAASPLSTVSQRSDRPGTSRPSAAARVAAPVQAENPAAVGRMHLSDILPRSFTNKRQI